MRKVRLCPDDRIDVNDIHRNNATCLEAFSLLHYHMVDDVNAFEESDVTCNWISYIRTKYKGLKKPEMDYGGADSLGHQARGVLEALTSAMTKLDQIITYSINFHPFYARPVFKAANNTNGGGGELKELKLTIGGEENEENNVDVVGMFQLLVSAAEPSMQTLTSLDMVIDGNSGFLTAAIVGSFGFCNHFEYLTQLRIFIIKKYYKPQHLGVILVDLLLNALTLESLVFENMVVVNKIVYFLKKWE